MIPPLPPDVEPVDVVPRVSAPALAVVIGIALAVGAAIFAAGYVARGAQCEVSYD
jgi:NaMN:DMB phosphoribosyltransferase